MKKVYLIAFLLAFVSVGCNKKGIGKATAIKPYKVTDYTFEQEVLNSNVPVVVDFWAAWCGPCKQMEPDLLALAAEYQGRVKFVKVNADTNTLTTYQYGVNALPTILFFENGNVADYSTGLTTKGTLKNKIEKILQ